MKEKKNYREIYVDLVSIYDDLKLPETMHMGFYNLGRLNQELFGKITSENSDENLDDEDDEGGCDCNCHC